MKGPFGLIIFAEGETVAAKSWAGFWLWQDNLQEYFVTGNMRIYWNWATDVVKSLKLVPSGLRKGMKIGILC